MSDSTKDADAAFAEELVDEALDRLHESIAEMLNIAVAKHGAGNLDEAEQLYRAILQSQPNNADAIHLLGVVAHQKGDHENAVQLIEQAIMVTPNNPDMLNNLGSVYQAMLNLPKAVETFETALRAVPDHVVSLYALGTTRSMQGDFIAARQLLERALEISPDHIDARLNLGNVLGKLGDTEAALAEFDKAIAARPDFVSAHNNRANALKNLGRLDEAKAAINVALGLQPNSAAPLINLGLIHLRAGEVNLGIDALQKALVIEPNNIDAHNNMGVACRDAGECKQAITHFDHVLETIPGHGDAHWNKSMALLVSGDLENGWPEYEWRWTRPEYQALRPTFPVDVWSGDDLTGKRIFINSEQGLGDTLQFIRYAKVLADKGAIVVAGTQPPLTSLISRTPGVTEVVPIGGEVPAVDCFQSLLTLPLLLKTTPETIPAETPYLFVDPEKTAAWASKLANAAGLKVGIAWRGNPKHPHNYRRSASVEAFAPLAGLDGVQLINLQIDASDQEKSMLPGLLDLTDQIADMDDTAALVANLDVVVGVDTAVVHLAGGMAKPVFNLIPTVPDWRWLLDRTDSPWYPSMTVYRQSTAGDWAEVISRVSNDLSAKAS